MNDREGLPFSGIPLLFSSAIFCSRQIQGGFTICLVKIYALAYKEPLLKGSCCLRLQWHHFPFPFLPPNPPISPALLSFKFRISFFINCCYLGGEEGCPHVHVFLNTCKYNLASPCNVIIMDVFKTDHLMLVDQLVFSSPPHPPGGGETVSPILSIPQLPAVLCLGLQPVSPTPHPQPLRPR